MSRKDAELHLALGAKLAAKGDAKDATALWETGCVRLRTYVDDATAEDRPRMTLRLMDALTRKGSTGQGITWRTRGLAAFSVGLDPKNPYVTQQTNTQFLWYELESDGAGAPDEDYSFAGDAKVKRRRVGARAATTASLASQRSMPSCLATRSRTGPGSILIAPTGRRRYAVTRSLSRAEGEGCGRPARPDDAAGTGRRLQARPAEAAAVPLV